MAHWNYKHGETKTRLFKVWDNMVQRCTNPKYTKYKNYGGRDIYICEEWREFINFRNWAVSNGYSDDLTIDRIDNNKGYSPQNCRWVTYKEQNNNQRRNLFLEYKGQTKTLADWSIKLGINYGTLRSRLQRNNWSVEKAFSTPVRRKEQRKCRVNL